MSGPVSKRERERDQREREREIMREQRRNRERRALYMTSLMPTMPSGQKAWNGASGYCAAKAGLDHFARCLALEEAHRGIRVNVVSPGMVLVDHHVERTGQDPTTDEGSVAWIFYRSLESSLFSAGVTRPGSSCPSTSPWAALARPRTWPGWWRS